jgi:hypothetical protein
VLPGTNFSDVWVTRPAFPRHAHVLEGRQGHGARGECGWLKRAPACVGCSQPRLPVHPVLLPARLSFGLSSGANRSDARPAFITALGWRRHCGVASPPPSRGNAIRRRGRSSSPRTGIGTHRPSSHGGTRRRGKPGRGRSPPASLSPLCSKARLLSPAEVEASCKRRAERALIV